MQPAYITFTNSWGWDMFLDLVHAEGTCRVISYDIDPFLNDQDWNTHVCIAHCRHPMVIDMCHIDAKVDAVIYIPEARILINRFSLSHINFAPDMHYMRISIEDTFQIICIQICSLRNALYNTCTNFSLRWQK